MVLLAVQTSLIAAGKAAVHRRFGLAGAVLGVLMMVAGAYVATTRMRAGLMVPPPGMMPPGGLKQQGGELPALPAAPGPQSSSPAPKGAVVPASASLPAPPLSNVPGLTAPARTVPNDGLPGVPCKSGK